MATAQPAEAPAARLADLTTLRVGGRPERQVIASTIPEIIDAVDGADASGEPVLLVGGGSNLLVGDGDVPGVTVRVATRGIHEDSADMCGGAVVSVAAGESWDGFVAYAVERGWVGVEALSGIPGSVGATPIQNVGAYGQEVADTIARVRTWDRQERRQVTFAAADCGFGYRTSRFKEEPGRYVVLEVVFQLEVGDLGRPVRYGELARSLGVDGGGRAPLPDVRAAVLGLRAGKGMVLDADDHDTWSAGSFFTNPVLDAAAAARLPDDAPRYDQPDGSIKTSAAWLIEHAGFAKGWGSDLTDGRASLSSKHTLALTNRGGASAADLLRVAGAVRDGVREAYGITLVNEPVLVGCALTAGG